MSPYDRLIPAKALRWGRLTKCWPWSDANPAVGPIVDPAALWGEHDRLAEGRGHPLDLAAVIAAGEGIDKTGRRITVPESGRYAVSASVVIRPVKAPKPPVTSVLRSWWWRLLHALPMRASVWLRVRLYGRDECAYCHVPAWLNPRWGHAEWLGHEWEHRQ